MSNVQHGLTTEQNAKVVGLYLGAEVFDDYDNDVKVLYSVTCDNVLYLLKNVQHKRTLQEVKLLLTPLSSISKEDAIEVAKMGIAFGEGFEEKIESCGIFRHETEINILLNISWEEFGERTHEHLYVHFIWHKGLTITKVVPNGERLPCYNQSLIVQFLIQRFYAVPLFIAPGHPDNGKTAIELGLAIDRTKATGEKEQQP